MKEFIKFDSVRRHIAIGRFQNQSNSFEYYFCISKDVL